MSISTREKSNVNLTKQNESAKQAVDIMLSHKIKAIESLLKARLSNPIGDLSKCTTITKILAHIDEELALEDHSNKRSSLYEAYRKDLKERYEAIANQVKAINANPYNNSAGISEEELESEVAEKTKHLQSQVTGLCADIYTYKNQCTELENSLINARNLLETESEKVKALRAQLAIEQSKNKNVFDIGKK